MKTNLSEKLVIDGTNLSLENLVKISRTNGATAQIADEAKIKMKKSREWVDQVQKAGKPVVYGFNTGLAPKQRFPSAKNG